MVKQIGKDSISEDDVGSQVLNENGKRSADIPDKETNKRLKTKSLYRQPTANELNRLQETANLFNSNLFRLQVEEILEEVKVKEKTEKKFQFWYNEFKNHMLSISEDGVEYDLTEPKLAKKLKIKLPISNRLSKTKCMFKFIKFTNIEIVGSYALGCSINSKLCVDVQITVPADTYTKNDSINYRYSKKRAAYLAVIASHLRDHESVAEINYSLDACETRPVLDIVPSGKLGKHLTVRIDLSCEAEAYKLHRFSPLRNNLRESWLFSEDNETTEIGPPTPYYNSSILQDLTASINEEFLRDTISKCENLKQAVVLLKIWVRQRNLNISGYILSMIVAHLVQTKRVNNIMSSYQIVRNVWIALKAAEWDVKGVSLCKNDNSPTLEEFHQHFPVVFLDRTGYYNICWQMCKGTFDALKRESGLAVEMLDDSKLNSFLPLFMTPVQPLLQFDHIIRFKNLEQLKESVISKVAKSTRLNYGVDELCLVRDTLHALLARGLGGRVRLVVDTVDAAFAWPVTTSLDKARKDRYKPQLSFGLIMNPETYMNNVDRGPPANLPEAEDFRAFWGAKSELRRFQDGSITEAVVWDADTSAERRSVAKQVVDYLLNLKYGIDPSGVFHVCAQLERVWGGRCAEDAAVRALRAFDSLRRRLRQLQHAPLDVSACAGVSPVFSYCEPFPVVPQRPLHNPWRRGQRALIKEIPRDGTWLLPPYVPVCEAVIELGHSGKWPGEVEALRCLKAAVLLQLAQALSAQQALPAHAQRSHVDVLADGLVFRLRLAVPKEITLLRKKTRDGRASFRETEESVRLLRDTVLMPRLRGALHGLHVKHGSFGPAACLLQRWLRAQLLGANLVPSIIADLLTAAVFVRPAPLAAPASPQAAFLRVLKLIAQTDWKRELIVLDFNDDFTREEIADLEQQFSSRSPQTARIHIVTAHDGDAPGAWGGDAPAPRTLARMQALANTALDYFTKALLDDFTDNVLGAFVPSLSGYDVLIRLRPQLVPYCGERVGRKPCTTPATIDDEAAAEATVLPVVDFHPVDKYLGELTSAYGEFALFFHDSYGGDVIAVLWKPDIKEYKEFQPLTASALKPVSARGQQRYRVNIAAVAEDFRRLGDGLVLDVVVNT